MMRTAEPELMLREDQASAYAAADLFELNEPMVARFQACFGMRLEGTLLDLGCGAADVSIRFCRAYAGIHVVGVDGSATMLAEGRRAIKTAGLESRIRLEQRHLPDPALETGAFDAVIANSLLHHLQDPALLWRTMALAAKPGAPILCMDLRRPAGLEAASGMVIRYAADARPVLQDDFFKSLCAAYTAREIRGQLDGAGLGRFQVVELGELHVAVSGTA